MAKEKEIYDMNLGELIEKLKQLDPKTIVMMSSDEEGNQFGRLFDIDVSGRHPETNKPMKCIILYPDR